MSRSSIAMQLMACVLLCSTAHAEQATVKLQKGGEVTGELLEYVPGDHVALLLSDGQRLEFAASDVASVQLLSSRPAPAPAPAPVPAPASPTASSAGVAADPAPPPATVPEAKPTARVDALRIAARPSLGFAGEAHSRVGEDDKGPSDMLATFGVEVELEVPLHTYFTLAAALRFSKFNLVPLADEGAGRSTAWDLLLVPRLRYPLLVAPLELFVAVPIGPSSCVLNDSVDLEPGTNSGTIGFTLAVMGGVAWFVSDSVGLSLQLGYEYSSFNFTDDDSDPEPLALSLAQVRASAGVVVALQ